MNYRKMQCGKHEVIAVGNENSINDSITQLEKCFSCNEMILCQYSSDILENIIKQQGYFRIIEGI